MKKEAYGLGIINEMDGYAIKGEGEGLAQEGIDAA